MNESDGRKRADDRIRNGDIAGLRSFLIRARAEPWFGSDFALLLALTEVHELELKNGRKSLFERYRQMDRLIADHYALRRALRRLEWTDDTPAEEILSLMEEKGFSAFEVGWEVNACCVHKNSVWEMIRNAG